MTATGTLTVADVETGENVLQTVARGTWGLNGYGSFEVSAEGVWIYTLDNDHPAVQSLEPNESLSDTLAVASEDSSASAVITVTIIGASEPSPVM